MLPSITTNLSKLTLLATCFGRPRPSSYIKVRNLKPKHTCVKCVLQIVRAQKFYNSYNIALLRIFYSVYNFLFCY